MHIHFSGSGSHAIFLVAVPLMLVALYLALGRKLPLSHTRKPKNRRCRFAGAVLGNALQAMHMFVDPAVRYVIAEKLEESSEDDGEDDSADPAIHLERQLRRIRRGERVERLKIRMKEKE